MLFHLDSSARTLFFFLVWAPTRVILHPKRAAVILHKLKSKVKIKMVIMCNFKDNFWELNAGLILHLKNITYSLTNAATSNRSSSWYLPHPTLQLLSFLCYWLKWPTSTVLFAFLPPGRYQVVGGIVSPVSDGYRKQGLVPAKHRIAMARLALQSSNWVTVDEWESQQADWTETAVTMRYYSATTHTLWRKVIVNQGG